MEFPLNLQNPIIARPTEHERLVAALIDQRFFGPVAITTSLDGARGMGKTVLAREVCRDPRIAETFPDGVLWVTVGEKLSPLQLLSRIERLVYDLTGEQHGLIDLSEAEKHLRQLIHPRRVLLVLDEANDSAAVRPFLQTGPGGGVLIITRGGPDALPLGTRCIPVDIMVTEEAAALLASGLIDLKLKPAAGALESRPLPLPFQSTPLPPMTRPEGLPGNYLADAENESGRSEHPLMARMAALRDQAPQAELRTSLVDPASLEALRQLEAQQRMAGAGLLEGEARRLVELAGRLNEWPLLLTLTNGLLRGCLEPGDKLGCSSLDEALQTVDQELSRRGLEVFWPVTNAFSRRRAVSAVIDTCLEPLSLELCQRLFDLVVFPLDEDIPLAAVATLWRTTSGETYEIAGLLARRALVGLDAGSWTMRLNPVISGYINDHLRVGVLTGLNRGLVEGYGERCTHNPQTAGPPGWATGPDDGYFFQHLASHLVAAGLRSELQKLLFDFTWLSAYLTCTNLLTGRRGDLYSLLLDFEIALSINLDQQSAELRLIEDALRLAAPHLARDPGELSVQLLGRLLPFQEPEIQGLLRQAENWTEQSWLRPISACFAVPGGDEVRTIRGHEDWVTGLAILPDGQHALSGSLDGNLRSWDLANGQCTRTILAHSAGVSAVAISPDGRKAVTAGWDGRVCIWDVISGESLLEFTAHDSAIGAMILSPDGQFIFTASDDRLIRMWDMAGGKPRLEMVGHGDPVRSLAISPDGRTLISGSWDYTVRIWDLEVGKQMGFLTGHTAWLSAVAITPDGGYVISGGWDHCVRIWDLFTGELDRMIEGIDAPIYSLALNPAADRLLVGTGDGALLLYDFATGEQLRALRGHKGGINQVSTTREGRFAISAGDDRTLRIWDLVAIQAVRPQPGHSAPVYALETLPNGRLSLSGSWDSTLKLWDLDTGAEVCTFSGHQGGVIALAVSSDGRRAVSGSRDHTLKVWNLVENCEERTLSGHAGSITAVSITPDGLCGVSGADDGTLKVWDLNSGVCLADFRGEGSIWACAIARDGRTIVASESGGKMYFLEIKQ